MNKLFNVTIGDSHCDPKKDKIAKVVPSRCHFKNLWPPCMPYAMATVPSIWLRSWRPSKEESIYSDSDSIRKYINYAVIRTWASSVADSGSQVFPLPVASYEEHPTSTLNHDLGRNFGYWTCTGSERPTEMVIIPQSRFSHTSLHLHLLIIF